MSRAAICERSPQENASGLAFRMSGFAGRSARRGSRRDIGIAGTRRLSQGHAPHFTERRASPRGMEARGVFLRSGWSEREILAGRTRGMAWRGRGGGASASGCAATRRVLPQRMGARGAFMRIGGMDYSVLSAAVRRAIASTTFLRGVARFRRAKPAPSSPKDVPSFRPRRALSTIKRISAF